MRRALLVLGMHRSGTSALAGLMVRLGADSPRTLMPPNEFNPQGYWESESIVAFHDRLLRALGSSWDAWTPLDASQAAPFADELTRIISTEFGSAPMFVVKDPRMCRLVPFWLSALDAAGITPAVILVARDPVEVSHSLAVRDGLAPEFSLLMWLRHMIDAELETRSIPRSIVSYGELLTDWHAVAERISRDLRFAWPGNPDQAGDGIAQFLKADLRHHISGSEPLQAPQPLARWAIRTRDAFDQLRRGDQAQTSEALAALDEVRAQLDETSLVFGRADEAVRSGMFKRLEQVEASSRAIKDDAAILEADRSRLRQHADAIAIELQQTRGRAEEEQRRAAGLEVEVVRILQDAAALRAEYTALSQHDTRLQQAHQQLTEELSAARHEIQALRSSWSWRVTSPLRALWRLVKGDIGRS